MARSHFKACLVLFVMIVLLPAGSPGQSSDEVAYTPRRRLPNYFGQIGISERQRERIYSLQAQYNSQIAELEARIDELKTVRDAEIEAVLTDAQQRRLEDRREAARLAREARRRESSE